MSFQDDAATHIYERNASLLFAKPGSGKTRAVLMAMQDLIDEKQVKRFLVVAPLRVVQTVWQQEIAKWGFHLSSTVCTGETKNRREAIQSTTDVLIVNYDMLKVVLAEDHGCDAIVIDEISKLRSSTGAWNKLIVKAGFRFAVGMTGTPTPNNLLSLYGMARAVGIEVWGRSFDKWKRTHFYPTDYHEYDWKPLPGNTLAEDLKPYVYTLDEASVKLPPVVRPPMRYELPPDIRAAYDEMRSTSVLTDLEIIAANEGVMAGKLRQIAAGFVYDNQGNPVSFSPWRIDIVADLVDEMQGEPLLVVYEWKEQLEMLRKRFPKAPYLGGGSRGDAEVIALWCRRELPVMLLHSAAAGHGVNLAAGGNAICWLQVPYDNELYTQTLGRLVRRDQPKPHVYSYEIAAERTLDDAVLRRLAAREQAQDQFWKEVS